MQNPEASFDVLYIVHRLDAALHGISQLQIQKLAFLGCVLSMYEGSPAAEWGYLFATTEFGRPICSEITDSLHFFGSAGLIGENEGRYSETAQGAAFLRLLLEQATFNKRLPYVKAACDSALAVSAGILNQGIDNEPTLANSEIRARGDSLLTGPALHILHEHFSGLREVLGEKEFDLLIPSLAWLSYTADTAVSTREPQA